MCIRDSTTSALVAAAGGMKVAKHGNRAASSKCGAADVLEALGVNITVSPAQSAQMLKDINICFLFHHFTGHSPYTISGSSVCPVIIHGHFFICRIKAYCHGMSICII